MNKTDLVAALATQASLQRIDAQRIIDLLFDPDAGLITAALRRGDKVQISGFGTFETRKRAARTGRNPRTGDDIPIPPSTTAAFRAGQALKDRLNTA
jgi:DNA-binding protein HU-beta